MNRLTSEEQQLVNIVLRKAKDGPLNGRFVEVQELGSHSRGAFSVMMQARDLRTNHKVVLKFLSPNADDYRKACFIREAEASAKFVGKPHVVQLAGDRQGLTVTDTLAGLLLPVTLNFEFFALERATTSLTGFLLTGARPRSLARRLEVLRDVVKGIRRLHAEGYCHRDIKPDNILLFAGGEAKVADLGTCRLHSGVDQLAANYFSPVGDQMYAAPEMFCGAGHHPDYYLGADWFGFGAVLFEAVTGQNLYVAIGLQSPAEIRRTIAAAATMSEFTRIVGSAVGKYPIPATSDFVAEPWLAPLTDKTHATVTSLMRDLCNFDPQRRTTDGDAVLRRLEIGALQARRDLEERARQLNSRKQR